MININKTNFLPICPFCKETEFVAKDFQKSTKGSYSDILSGTWYCYKCENTFSGDDWKRCILKVLSAKQQAEEGLRAD